MYQDIVDTIHIYIIYINEEKERGSAQFLQRCSLSLFSGVEKEKKRTGICNDDAYSHTCRGVHVCM